MVSLDPRMQVAVLLSIIRHLDIHQAYCPCRIHLFMSGQRNICTLLQGTDFIRSLLCLIRLFLFQDYYFSFWIDNVLSRLSWDHCISHIGWNMCRLKVMNDCLWSLMNVFPSHKLSLMGRGISRGLLHSPISVMFLEWWTETWHPSYLSHAHTTTWCSEERSMLWASLSKCDVRKNRPKANFKGVVNLHSFSLRLVKTIAGISRLSLAVAEQRDGSEISHRSNRISHRYSNRITFLAQENFGQIATMKKTKIDWKSLSALELKCAQTLTETWASEQSLLFEQNFWIITLTSLNFPNGSLRVWNQTLAPNQRVDGERTWCGCESTGVSQPHLWLGELLKFPYVFHTLRHWECKTKQLFPMHQWEEMVISNAGVEVLATKASMRGECNLDCGF